jgi:hypothetical protein
LTALGIITQINKASLQLFYICIIVLFALFVWRVIFTRWLPKICGICQNPLGNIQQGQCSECKNYNTYDTKLWSKLEFTDIKAVYRAEKNWLLQNIIALSVVLLFFLSPLFYLFFIVDSDIHALNEKRRIALSEIRSAFFKYSDVHHKYPTKLKQLRPNYLSKIPTILKNGKGVFVIHYAFEKGNATFTFHVSHAPLSTIHYNVGLDEYEYDSVWAKFLWKTSQLF